MSYTIILGIILEIMPPLQLYEEKRTLYSMTLHMTKIAYGHDSVECLEQSLMANYKREQELFLTTRYRPKRYEEMLDGSLYWIVRHQIMCRSEIINFRDAPDGRTQILLKPDIIRVKCKPRRAHQGWRYLSDDDIPSDLAPGERDFRAEMPSHLVHDLTKLALI